MNGGTCMCAIVGNEAGSSVDSSRCPIHQPALSTSGQEIAQPRNEPGFWETIWSLHEQWQKVWKVDKSKYLERYPKWIVDASEELFAHDMCDAWDWNEYVSAAAVIIARHFNAAQSPAVQALESQPQDLHAVICQAVGLMNQGETYKAHTVLREALIKYADAPVESLSTAQAQEE